MHATKARAELHPVRVGRPVRDRMILSHEDRIADQHRLINDKVALRDRVPTLEVRNFVDRIGAEAVEHDEFWRRFFC